VYSIKLEYIIDENYEEVRLDKFIRKKYKALPLSLIYNMIRKGQIKVNHKKSKENYRLIKGDLVFIYSEEENKVKFIELSNKEYEIVKKSIVYDNNGIVIINKEPELVVHKGTNHDYGLLEMLKSYYKTDEFAFINRIDKSTSGLVIAGKDNKTVRELSKLIREDKIKRFYYVKVKGNVNENEFIIKNYIDRTETTSIISENGKESITKFKLIKKEKNYSVLEAELITGRTHQIRVQLSSIELPIFGDYKYGYKQGEIMCLFSHKIIIENGITIDLEIPKYFYE